MSPSQIIRGQQGTGNEFYPPPLKQRERKATGSHLENTLRQKSWSSDHCCSGSLEPYTLSIVYLYIIFTLYFFLLPLLRHCIGHRGLSPTLLTKKKLSPIPTIPIIKYSHRNMVPLVSAMFKTRTATVQFELYLNLYLT